MPALLTAPSPAPAWTTQSNTGNSRLAKLQAHYQLLTHEHASFPEPWMAGVAANPAIGKGMLEELNRLATETQAVPESAAFTLALRHAAVGGNPYNPVTAPQAAVSAQAASAVPSSPASPTPASPTPPTAEAKPARPSEENAYSHDKLVAFLTNNGLTPALTQALCLQANQIAAQKQAAARAAAGPDAKADSIKQPSIREVYMETLVACQDYENPEVRQVARHTLQKSFFEPQETAEVKLHANTDGKLYYTGTGTTGPSPASQGLQITGADPDPYKGYIAHFEASPSGCALKLSPEGLKNASDEQKKLIFTDVFKRVTRIDRYALNDEGKVVAQGTLALAKLPSDAATKREALTQLAEYMKENPHLTLNLGALATQKERDEVQKFLAAHSIGPDRIAMQAIRPLPAPAAPGGVFGGRRGGDGDAPAAIPVAIPVGYLDTSSPRPFAHAAAGAGGGGGTHSLPPARGWGGR